MIRVIAGGKKASGFITAGIDEYTHRLVKPFDVKFEYYEEEKLNKFLESWPFTGNDYVILLDERGKNITSPELSKKLQDCFIQSKNPIIIIGGAYGVTQEVRNKANFVWSVSNLVFPHELMRVLLSEQLYRAQSITNGSKYHHE